MKEQRRFPIAKTGYPFIGASILFALAVWYMDIGWLKLPSVLAGLFLMSFFRDPERDIPVDSDAIVSPADGRIIKVERLYDDRFLKGEAVRVSVFMNLFDVHVNRAPASGRVVRRIYNPGRFFSANLDKASTENEHNALIVSEADKRRYVINQIAGLVARRIVCYVKEGSFVEKGGRVGIIMFGSRCDVYLPPDARVVVGVGEKVKAGSSIIGYWQ